MPHVLYCSFKCYACLMINKVEKQTQLQVMKKHGEGRHETFLFTKMKSHREGGRGKVAGD